MTLAVCPGSFDPIHNGHIEIIARAAKIFSEGVIVAVAHNPQKTFRLPLEERVAMVQEVFSWLDGITVEPMGAGLLAELVDDSAGGIVRRRRALAELGLREDSQVSLVVIDLAAVPEPQFAERVLSPVAGVRLSAPWGGTWCVVGDRPDVPARVEAAVRHATEAVWQMAFLGPGEHFRDLPGAFHTLENALAVSREVDAGGDLVAHAPIL